MDAYPPDYVDHNLPLIVLSGLGIEPQQEDFPPSHGVLQDNGCTISSHLPLVTGERADQLRHDFLAADGRRNAWNGRAARSNSGLIGFRFGAIGREYTLPPRKAGPPPAHLTPSPMSPRAASPSSFVLHSPISPLSPTSPTFPDGFMTPLWLAKHQHYAPAVFLSFFSFTSDPNLNSLNDNQLKSEINNVKNTLSKSDYRTRYAVVLLSDKMISEAPDIDERLANIRRATGLDPKNALFFLPPNSSRVEISSFVTSVLLALQPLCVEYYRDLTKHSRRKKARGTIPPPTSPPTKGTSQTLPGQGWALRYEFKLGVFAEFRQEMDAACRHYNAAQDILLGPDGVFGTTASWSPRWNEARSLADTIAVRTLRCLIWNNLHTSAVQSWTTYRHRMRTLIDEHGKGSANYGWEAWESRWAKVMAELIQKAKLPVFNVSPPVKAAQEAPESENAIHAPPDRGIPIGERLAPFNLLHHPGYWLRLAATHAVSRRLLAEDLPDEDRVSPALLSASQVATRAGAYDTYLCPEPHVEYPIPGNEGFNHPNDVVTKYSEAIREFSARSQRRFADRLRLEIGKELMDAGRFDEALDTLKPLWSRTSWREERWWSLVSEVSSSLHLCALQLRDAETLLATEWELMHRDLGVRPGHSHDLMKCLDSFTSEDSDPAGKPNVRLEAEEIVSFVSVGCAFQGQEGHVGEPLRGQISISSKAHQGSAPVTFSNVTVVFEGNLSQVQLQHATEDNYSPVQSSTSSRMSEVLLQEENQSTSAALVFSATADLTIHPGQTKVFQFAVILKEAGDVRATTCNISVSTDRFDVACSSNLQRSPKTSTWWLQGPGGLRPKRLAKEDGMFVKILPKPPKVDLHLSTLRERYYTDERIALDIEIHNNEEDESDVSLEVQIAGSSDTKLDLCWRRAGQEGAHEVEESSEQIAQRKVGNLLPAAKHSETITFIATSNPSNFTVEIKALYHLANEPDTPITKILTADLVFASPFEASYDFQPRIHPQPWPSFFALDESSTDEESDERSTSSGRGIAQKWALAAQVGSLAEETLTISDMELVLHSASGGIECAVNRESPSGPEDMDLSPDGLDERYFCLDVQKMSLEDRRSSALEMSLRVTWRRADDDSSGVSSTISVPRLMVPNSEPRVLATSHASSRVESLVQLAYTLENPTMHFLTFDLTMEASDEFAFSGRKYGTLQVLPMSRQTVRYNLLPFVRGTWISPQLRVVDRYFNKTLRVLAADGVRADKEQIMVWVDVEADDG